jgi:hypothetical protein
MLRPRFLIAVLAVFAVMLAGSTAALAGGLFPKDATDQGYGGVGVTTTTTQTVGAVAGQGRASNSAPLAQTNESGTLPFTGAQLGVFLALGLALLVGGLLLHRTGRGRTDS